MSKDITVRSNVTQREPMPTPLMVTQRQDKSVTLKFNTQAEADAAWRILSALAEAHADRAWEQRDAHDEYERMKKEVWSGKEEPAKRHLPAHRHEPSPSQHMLAMDSKRKR